MNFAHDHMNFKSDHVWYLKPLVFHFWCLWVPVYAHVLIHVLDQYIFGMGGRLNVIGSTFALDTILNCKIQK